MLKRVYFLIKILYNINKYKNKTLDMGRRVLTPLFFWLTC